MIYKVKATRVERGIKQKDFAAELGVSQQHLVNIESGKVQPRRDLMIKIAELLNEEVTVLFFNKNIKEGVKVE